MFLEGPAELVASVGRLIEAKGVPPMEGDHMPEYLKFLLRGERQGERR